MRNIFLLCFIFILSGCQGLQPNLTTTSPSSRTFPGKEIRTLAPFVGISIQGNVDISLHTGYYTPKVILKGEAKDFAILQTFVRDGTLFLLANKKLSPDKVLVEIYINNLYSFDFKGKGHIRGTHIYARNLTLSIENTSNTHISGNISLTKMRATGPGSITLEGVQTSTLTLSMRKNPRIQLAGRFPRLRLQLEGAGGLRMQGLSSTSLAILAKGKSVVDLSGFTETLNVELWNKARFLGQHLRANRAFVKTHDYSIAAIYALSRQHTLALDASDIYFYHVPEMKTDFLAHQGSVLDMREWSPSNQPYGNYNK